MSKRISKKEKERLKQQQIIAKEVSSERNSYWKRAKEYKPNILIPNRNPESNIHYGPTHAPIETNKPEIEHNEEMILREKKAQEVTEILKKCSAPLYNKGAYQPVWTKDDALLVGRK